MNSLNIWIESVQIKTDEICKKFFDFTLPILRVWIGQEFLVAGYTKLSGGFVPPDWFVGLGFPFPHAYLDPEVNWIVAGGCEILFGSALILGVGVRIAALCLLYITYVAIYTVHFDLGWHGWNLIETDDGNGFKVPLMIAIMLLIIVAQGAGRWSIATMLEQRKILFYE